MSSSDRELKSMVMSFLDEVGIPSEEIPVRDSKTPDLLLARDTPDATLMELKTKKDNPLAIKEIDEELDQGGVVSRSQPTSKWNRLDGIIGHAVDQMKHLDPERSVFRTIWIHCVGLDADLSEMRLKATLYGTQKLFCERRPNIVTCHYFWNSSFFRFRDDLDGVIISRGDQAQLNLNDHSPKFRSFISSRLAAGFGEAIYYPQQFMDDEDFMYHDSSMLRSSEDEIIGELRAKYGMELIQTINLGLFKKICG